MLTFLRERFGGQLALQEAISTFRAQHRYKGPGATVMDAVAQLYEREKTQAPA